MALAFTKFSCFNRDLGLGRHVLSTDNLAVALSNTLPVITNQVLVDITEIAAGFGYAAGGPSLVNVAWTQATTVTRLFADDLTITAAGGSIGPFTYAVLYNKTSAAKYLIGWWARLSALTLATTESWLLDFSASNGLVQVS